MKNIHLLPTNKPSRLYKQLGALMLDTISDISKDGISENQHIYITSDEEIKVGDWVIEFQKNDNIGQVHFINGEYVIARDIQKKIILTTDDELYIHNDLIPKEYNPFPQYIQKIDDMFLEWFVKNPSCEWIEVYNGRSVGDQYDNYSLIIPEEEPKQLTDLEIAIKLEEIEREEVREVKRTDLYNSILSIVKQIPRENVESDAMDAPSCAYEIEQLFYKWQKIQLPSDEEIIENGANTWVFKTNSKKKWSNNDDTAGDNFGSFIAGAKWMRDKITNTKEK